MFGASAIAENLPWQPRGFVIISPQGKKKTIQKRGKFTSITLEFLMLFLLNSVQHRADTHLLNAAQDLHLKNACFVETVGLISGRSFKNDHA